MKYLLYFIIAFIVSTPSFAHTQELHHEEELKISIPFGEKYDYKNIKVKRVIDGDTLQLENGERVRLIGIKAPPIDMEEARKEVMATGQDLETITKMGQEATKFLKRLGLSGREVRLEFDVQERDKYGRLLAYIYIPIIRDFTTRIMAPSWQNIYIPLDDKGKYEQFLNAYILAMGYATPMTSPPNVKYAELFKELYEEAREQKRGLWKNIPNEKYVKDAYYCEKDEDCVIRDGACGFEPMNKYFDMKTFSKSGIFDCMNVPLSYENPRCENKIRVADEGE